MLAFHLPMITLLPIGPIIVVFADIDPFYYVLEILLPSAYDRSISQILGTIFLRVFLSTLGAFEYCRFSSFHLFFAISGACAMITCLKQLTNPFRKSEQSVLSIYTQLRIILKVLDDFLRHVVMLLMICTQVVATSLWWIVIKCYGVLPLSVYMMACIVALINTFVVVILLPRGVEISDSSEKFVEYKKASNHTYNKFNPKRYFYLQWKSQRMLPIRFGVQFIVNKHTPINYLNVLVTNLTNAILLIHP